jgi:hypothetical protein
MLLSGLIDSRSLYVAIKESFRNSVCNLFKSNKNNEHSKGKIKVKTKSPLTSNDYLDFSKWKIA